MHGRQTFHPGAFVGGLSAAIAALAAVVAGEYVGTIGWCGASLMCIRLFT